MEFAGGQQATDEADGAVTHPRYGPGQRQDGAADVPELEAILIPVGGRPTTQLLERVSGLGGRQPARVPADCAE